MARIHDLTTYPFAAGERIFYDTNVWAAINQLGRFSSDAAPYTAAHKRVLTVGAAIHCDALVLQEFANLMERDTVASFRKNRLNETKNLSGPDIKHFRKTFHFSEVAATVSDALRQILRQSILLNSAPDLSSITAYENGQEGFNDHLIARLCQDNDLALLTNDADFAAFDLKIVTALPALLHKNENSPSI